MGIHHLNRFLLDNCKKSSIRKTHLRELKHKIIVIDTSIYLYKFISENALIENMYLLISIFRHYSIIPIFVFDGKPPIEKKELLIQRKIQKQVAEQKYMEMKESISEIEDAGERQQIELELEQLKKQFINITSDDIQSVKTLMEYYGVEYLTANGESDELIAHLLQNNKIWGCLSDDMDMFVYGCQYVLRHISLQNHTVIVYDTKCILKDLDMSMKEFREITVISGTDYNIHHQTSLHETIKWFYQYKKHLLKNKIKKNSMGASFYDWLLECTKYIPDYDSLIKQYQMFDVTKMKDLDIVSNLSLHFSPIQKNELREFLKPHGFIFVN
jgi:hypothetical protein